jgi:cephalosporin-C deacetylase
MPLTFDFPLEKLKAYQGINPRPDDFDAYWDKGLTEVHESDPQAKLTEVTFPSGFAKCYDLYFKGVDGARIYAKLVMPSTVNDPCPALLNFHGYSGASSDWSQMLVHAANGFIVASLDCRGQGGRSEDPGGVKGTTLRGHIIRGLDGDPEDLYFRKVFLDLVQLARVVGNRPEVDSSRMGAFGGSQGGALTVACAALVPEIKMLAPAFPFLADYQRVWEMDQAEHAYEELKQYFRHHDPRHEREEAIFTRLGYIDIQHLARRIRGKVLWGIGHMDTICPPSTQFAVYNKITAPKEMVSYPDFGHEGLPGFDDLVFQFFRELLAD